MLRKFAVALLATSLVAGTAIAAESGSAGAIGAAAAVNAGAQAAPANPAKPAKLTKHVHKNVHRHLARGKVQGRKMAHHFKGKTHKSAHVSNGAKASKRAKQASVKTAKLPASRTN